MKTTMFAGLILLAPLCMQDPQVEKKPQDAKSSAPAVPGVGDPVPPFRLNDHTGTAVTVGGPSKSWTVVAFYPKAATPG